MEILNIISVKELSELIEKKFNDYKLSSVTVRIEEACGRYLAENIYSSVTVPAFRRSTKDGYAVRSSDVSGASESCPSVLSLLGDVSIGEPAGLELKAGETVYVPTGGMVPDGADAVIMIEYSKKMPDNRVGLSRPSFVKENVIDIGEDIRKGELVLETGRRLSAADLGVLASVGRTEVSVFCRPAVSIISTGDEISGPDEEIKLGRVRDINTFTIAAAAERMGCEVVSRQVVCDDEELLKKTLSRCHKISDIVLLSGGSSVGLKDYSRRAIDSLDQPEILCHGIAFKPGKPTIVAKAGGKPVIGLPGHPVSALVVFGMVGGHLVRLMNRASARPDIYIDALLLEDIKGAEGRETWQMVEIIQAENGYEARPVHGESGLITLLASSTGVIRIPRYTVGYDKGTRLKVYPIER